MKTNNYLCQCFPIDIFPLKTENKIAEIDVDDVL
jgi:hypothetical protein